MSKELYIELINLRNRLKTQNTVNGRTPIVCSNESIEEIVEHLPTDKNDLLKINGLGKTFVEKYGDEFMAVLNKFIKQNTTERQMATNIKETLKQLENRLINISASNKLLFSSKINSNLTQDLFFDNNPTYNQEVLDLIFGRKKSMILAELNHSNEDELTSKRFKNFVKILREVNEENRETGRFDFYIGYPFVIGKTHAEDFLVRAPLLLFPLEVDQQKDKITIKIDDHKDVIYNTNLVILQKKLLEESSELPANEFQELVESSFYDDVRQFFANQNITIIQEPLPDFSKAKDYTAEDFKSLTNGEFHFLNNASIGKYSLYDSAIQKDFNKLINSNISNAVLDEILTGVDLNKENQLIFEDQIVATPKLETSTKETDIVYINDLDTAQEAALRSVDYLNNLVLQGPPGTGKSQTITSLIANYVNKNKTVLVVSQKKAALDVIYSRLGSLSKYAVLINNTTDKLSFYSQLQKMFKENEPLSFAKNINNISSSIDDKIQKLETLKKSITDKIINGESALTIYTENLSNQIKLDTSLYTRVFAGVNKTLLKLEYSTLKNIFNKFNDETFVSENHNYCNLINETPCIVNIKTNLSFYDRNQMQLDFENYIKQHTEFLSKGFIAKLFKKRKLKNQLLEVMKKYFVNELSVNEIFANHKLLLNITNNYEDFVRLESIYGKLSKEEKCYFESLSFVKQKLNLELLQANTVLYDFIIYTLIDKFENSNKHILESFNTFYETTNTVNNLIKEKQSQSKLKLLNLLIGEFNDEIKSSKRYNEMLRQIEAKRHISIRKFVEKYDFEILKGIKIWLLTPEVVSEILPLETGLFDLLVFDEASQIFVEKGMPSIYRAKKVVICGDHKQLRPSNLGFGRFNVTNSDELEDFEGIDLSAALEEESLLDLARFKYPQVCLNYHYRAKYSELIAFSNCAFYNGALNVSPNTEIPVSPPIEVIKIEDGLWESRSNEKEAERVVQLLKDLLKNRKFNETIGVVTFNVGQRDTILDKIDEECLKDEEFAILYKNEVVRTKDHEDIGLFVKNIETVQGDERDIIIFSIGYAKNNEGKVVMNFGWLNQTGGENRLNVAISRAKRKIFVITSISPNELDVSKVKNNGPKLFKTYLEYCSAVSQKNKELEQTILNSLSKTNSNQVNTTNEISDLKNEVCEEITKLGYDYKTEVGSGNYKLSIAVIKDDKFLLGIEFDNELLNKDLTTKERDINREKYFKARGWQTYRIWSYSWWHNKTLEINKLSALLQSKLNG